MKKSYQFVFPSSDERIDRFFEAQPYKNLAFRVMVYDYIRRYGYTDVVMALLENPSRVSDVNVNQSVSEDGEVKKKRGRGRPRKEPKLEEVSEGKQKEQREEQRTKQKEKDSEKEMKPKVDDTFEQPLKENRGKEGSVVSSPSTSSDLKEQDVAIAGWTIPENVSNGGFVFPTKPKENDLSNGER